MSAFVFRMLAALWLVALAAPIRAATVEYIHTDALGSPVAVTNSAGQVIERREYEPYGRQLAPVLSNGPGYTGHVADAATGLNYMQQRYYDPQIGRFLSVDPVTASAGSGGNFNRYWYANNNPYRFTDPDGRRACGKSTTCQLSKGASGGVEFQNTRFERPDTAATAKIGQRAAAAANKALEPIARKNFKSAGSAARAWADRVQRIAERFNTEIASLLFYDGKQIAIGGATSDGWIHKVG